MTEREWPHLSSTGHIGADVRPVGSGNYDLFCTPWQGVLQLQMMCPSRESIEADEPASFQVPKCSLFHAAFLITQAH